MSIAASLLLAMFLAVPGAPEEGEQDAYWVFAHAYDRFGIVHGEYPEAEDLFRGLWEQATGHRPAALGTPGNGISVWIGIDELPDDLDEWTLANTLGEDGIRIFTAIEERNYHLVIGGANERATRYAIYEFFELYLWVRWLPGGEVRFLEHPPAWLPHIDYSHSPPFKHRAIDLPQGLPAAAMHVGPDFRFGVAPASLYDLIQPGRYFEAHPGFFAEIDGKRAAPTGLGKTHEWRLESADSLAAIGKPPAQLCMSHPALAEAITAEIETRIPANPEADVWSVSQNNWGGFCQCARCAEINTREESPMGAFLTGVNRVAETVAKRHPGHRIHTRAHLETRRPPKTLRPSKHVIIELSTAGCDALSKTFDSPDPAEKSAFVDDLRAWRRVAKCLTVRDYLHNQAAYLRPFPNFDSIAGRLRFLAAENIDGLRFEGLPGAQSPFGHLRPYAAAKLLWNPNLAPRSLMGDFTALWFGNAAEPIRAYIDLATETVREKGVSMDWRDPGAWIDAGFIARAEAQFQAALAAAKNPDSRRRVEMAHLPIQFAAMGCPPEPSPKDGQEALVRPPCLSIEAFIAQAKKLGVRYYGSPKLPLEAGLARAFRNGLLFRVSPKLVSPTHNSRR